MTIAVQRGKRHRRPKLNKHFVATHDGWDVYAVDASVVRNIAQPDEEFGNFATRDEFRTLIPPGEIWISEKIVDTEGIFFIANALARLKEQERGCSDDKAYTAGLDVERALREKLTGLKFRAGKPHRRVPPELYVGRYLILPDEKFPIEVWLVDGNMVRSLYKTDYTEGGHGYVYRWVPKQEIWIEKNLDRWELPFIVSHEYLELRLMRDEGIEYDKAHEICARVEFHMRKGEGVKRIVVPGRRRFVKRDVPKLTGDDVFQYVVTRCLKR